MCIWQNKSRAAKVNIINTIKSQNPSCQIFIESILPNSNKEKVPTIIDLNEMLQSLSNENGITFIDLYNSFTDSNNLLKEEYSKDGTHINENGYKVWYDIIKDYL